MDILEQAQSITENTERMVRGSMQLLVETKMLLKEADATCQAVRAQLDSQRKSLLDNPEVRPILGALN